MPLFNTADDCYAVMNPFLSQLIADPQLGPKFAAGNTSFKVTYTEPDVVMMLDCTQNPPLLLTGAEADAAEAEVNISMSADDGHKFWLGAMNIPMSLARKKMKVSGPVTKLLGLLPAIQPAFERYQAHSAALNLPVTK